MLGGNRGVIRGVEGVGRMNVWIGPVRSDFLSIAKLTRIPATVIFWLKLAAWAESPAAAAVAWSPCRPALCSELAVFIGRSCCYNMCGVGLGGFAPPGFPVGAPLRLSLIHDFPCFTHVSGRSCSSFHLSSFPDTTPNNSPTTSQHSPRCPDPIAAMWLVNCSNYLLEPNDVDGPEPKPYWILSHTWGDDEVTFQDMQNLTLARQKRGFQKVRATCRLASASGVSHVWIDTCCIDKTSSAELTESINSMFYWYRRAAHCVAYLEDLEPDIGIPAVLTEAHLGKCRWFTRGWTLQELLAPSEVEFYDRRWISRGLKTNLGPTLSHITKIRTSALNLGRSGEGIEARLQQISVATKMSWAAGRKTTRLEDKAYCLLGIFGVQLPLLYGEREQAFTRLQQEIAHKGNDMSLFAWAGDPQDALVRGVAAMFRTGGQEYSGLLASDPSQFPIGTEVVQIDDPLLPPPSWTLANAGLEMTTSLDQPADSDYTILTRDNDNITHRKRCHSVHPQCYRLFLHCRAPNLHESNAPSNPHGWDMPCLAIWLRKTSSGFVRYKPTELCSVQMSSMKFNDLTHVRILTSLTQNLRWECKDLFGSHGMPPRHLRPKTVGVRWNIASRAAQFDYTYHPAHLWDRGRLSNADTLAFDMESFTIGLVKVTISNRFDSEPFSRTCWVCCGMVFKGSIRDPWVELVCEDMNGYVAILGQICDSRKLTNPFALASLRSKLRARNVRPEPRSLANDCFVRCTPTLHLSLRASEFTVSLPDTGGVRPTHLVTITADRIE